MSIERALIAQARPQMVAAKARDTLRKEISKGCRPEISSTPVSLEPLFMPLWKTKKNLEIYHSPHWAPESPTSPNDLTRLRLWISSDQKFDWNQSERFIKQLQTMSFRAGFEVTGNNEGIIINFLVHNFDLPIITAAFQGEFECCELTPIDKSIIATLPGKRWEDIRFRDYFPPPPYSHLLTRPPELQSSALKSLITAISKVEAPVVCLYQAIFKAVLPEHNWHRNISILLDFEYTIKLQDGFHIPQRYAQQAPSGDLRQMAWELENKAHNDKPLYAKRKNNVLVPMRSLMKFALKAGLIDKNPMDLIENLTVSKPDIHPLSIDEVRRFLDVVKPQYKNFFTVAFYTGMRFGEMAGLKWKNVDFRLGVIKVRETRVRGEEGRPKTAGSVRDIKMLFPVVEALRDQRKATMGKSDYVFLNFYGRPLLPNSVNFHIWKPALRKAGLKPRSLYQTRHTFATLMLDAGELPGWAQKMMGHESLKMILERYYSYIKNYQRDDGSAFMDNVYNPSVKQDDEMPDENEKSENFTPNLHQNEKRELM